MFERKRNEKPFPFLDIDSIKPIALLSALLISNRLRSTEGKDRGAWARISKSKEGIGQLPRHVALSRDLRKRRRFVVIYMVSNP